MLFRRDCGYCYGIQQWYLSCDYSYTTPQILASCIKAALGDDAHFRPLTEKEGILFQQQQELEGETLFLTITGDIIGSCSNYVEYIVTN